MERQNEPLARKKPWEEMTEEERQVISESWKHTLPEEFDVFYIGDLVLKEDLNVPGNLYVSGNISEKYLSVDICVAGHFYVGGDIDAGNVTVAGDFIVEGNVDSICDANIQGNFIAIGSNVNVCDVNVLGDFIVWSIDSYAIDVDGILDCNDIDANAYEIHANDYVCRIYEEES